jgi:hypothetical protein
MISLDMLAEPPNAHIHAVPRLEYLQCRAVVEFQQIGFLASLS